MEPIGEKEVSRDGPTLPNSRRPSIFTYSRRQSQLSVGTRRSITGFRGSLWGAFRGGFPKSIKYENTYRMEPKEQESIKQAKLSEMVEDLLKHSLQSEVYDPQRVQSLVMNITNVLRKRAREICTPSRYKIITQVHIGSSKDTDVSIAGRAIWHPESGDTFAEASFSNASIFAVALVYCVYFE